jgi:hypothetical protein
MLQILAQYQNYILTAFVTIEVLRYIYGAYTSWQANKIRICRINAGIEFIVDLHSTILYAMMSGKFLPLNEKARTAFNTAIQPNYVITDGMWLLINETLKKLFQSFGFLDDEYKPENVPHKINIGTRYPFRLNRFKMFRFPKQVNNSELNFHFPTHPFDSSKFATESVPKFDIPIPPPPPPVSFVNQPTEEISLPQTQENLQTTPVTEHPLQTPTSTNTSIYEGMELNPSKDIVQSDQETDSTIKRPRFGIATSKVINV